jgi:periplasmic protein TonB
MNRTETSTDTQKLMTAALPALVITFLLFALMQELIGTGAVSIRAIPIPIDNELPEPRKDSQPNHIVRTLPEPERPMPRPESFTPDATGEAGPLVELSVDPVLPAPGLDAVGDFMLLDKTATAVVRIDPKYPTQAAKDGIEGWVKLSFSIDATGSVIDVQVLDAEPKRIFDREAIKALKAWKYQPQMKDGKPVAQQGMQVQLDFSLDKA